MADTTNVSHEASIRLIAFVIILATLIVWERCAASRATRISLARRWSTNFGMGALDTLIVRVIFPAGVVGAAMLAARRHMGIFNQLSFMGYAALVASVVLLDLTIYLQHRLLHAVPWLWRVHRVHHADPHIDVSTALRFHPLESVLSMLLKAAVAIAFGMPAIGVLIFEVTLNGAAMFNHTNASLPQVVERLTRLILVTPDMHRIHHSSSVAEANRNFGFSVSWWDRLFGTYSAPSGQRVPTSIGLPDESFAHEQVQLRSLLMMPFRGQGGG